MTAAWLTVLVLALGIASNLGFAAWFGVTPMLLASFWLALPYLLFAAPTLLFRRSRRTARAVLLVAFLAVAASAAVLSFFLVIRPGPTSGVVFIPLFVCQVGAALLALPIAALVRRNERRAAVPQEPA